MWTVELSAPRRKSTGAGSGVVVRHATGVRKTVPGRRGGRLCVQSRSLGPCAGTCSGVARHGGGQAVARFLYEVASARAAARDALSGRCDVGRCVHEEIARKTPRVWPPRPPGETASDITGATSASLEAADHTVLFYGILGAHAAVQIRAGSRSGTGRPLPSTVPASLAGASTEGDATAGDAAGTGAVSQQGVPGPLGSEGAEAAPSAPVLPTPQTGHDGLHEEADMFDGASDDWVDGQEEPATVAAWTDEDESEGGSAGGEDCPHPHDWGEEVPLTVLPIGAFRCEHEAAVTAFVAVSLRPPAALLRNSTGASAWAIVSCILAQSLPAMGMDDPSRGVLPSASGYAGDVPDEMAVDATPGSDGASMVGNWSCSHCPLGHRRHCVHIARALSRCGAELKELIGKNSASSTTSAAAPASDGSHGHGIHRVVVLPVGGTHKMTWSHIPRTDRVPRSVIVLHDVVSGPVLRARYVVACTLSLPPPPVVHVRCTMSLLPGRHPVHQGIMLTLCRVLQLLTIVSRSTRRRRR